MKIVDLYRKGSPVLSLEIFPPRMDYPLETVFETIEKLTRLRPGFISVTYGAGGSNRDRTVEIAARIKNDYQVESLAHLTCVRHTREEINLILNDLLREGIVNIMALRGDPPEGDDDFQLDQQEYRYAYELINDARKLADFGIAAAAHPEGHPECRRLNEDLENLKYKVDCGVDYLITQLFFDNRIFYDFADRAIAKGINCPIIPGIMPVLNAKQIKRMIYMCGASIPSKLLSLVDRYDNLPADMEKAGIEYASEQVLDLIDGGVAGVHLYTMNKPEQITTIVNNVGMNQ
jgi:methylenetetrahydrofolate reductase (NADPH)